MKVFVLDQIFLQVRFQICCYLWGQWPGAVNLDKSNKYIYDAFLMIYLSIFVPVVVVVVVLLQRV